LAEILRYSNIFQSQVGALRKSVLLGLFHDDKLEGAYWGIKSATTSFSSPQHVSGYSKETARLVARVRTDLDAFSREEAAVLENHGYALAEAALRTHAAHLVNADTLPFELPHPEHAADVVARHVIKDSDRRKLFGRRAERG
jgi:NTE family protein